MKKLLGLVLLGLVVACTSLPPVWQMQVDRDPVKLLSAPGAGNGSGVVIRPNVILTARHVADVLDQGVDLYVEPGHIKVNVMKKSKDHDLALMFAPGVNCPCAPLADNYPEILDEVWTIGFPFNAYMMLQVLTRGHFMGITGDKIVTTSPAAPGNSGGGVFSVEGLIGILVEGIPGSGHLNKSVSLETIKKFLSEDG